MAEWTCEKCDGMGMLVIRQPDGHHLAQPCECRVERRNLQLLQRSRIPERYEDCTLENYDHSYRGAHNSLWQAFNLARGFVTNYPHRIKGVGLLFTGDVGTGKTHLAVAILRSLVLDKGVPALFCDHRGLLKAVNNSYNPRVATTELEILKPVFEAEVLVIDELGSAKKTEWVSDIVEHILNTRYNDHRTTIITTNYPNLPAGRGGFEADLESRDQARGSVFKASDESAELTLSRLDRLRNDLDRKIAARPGEPLPEPSTVKPLIGGQAASPMARAWKTPRSGAESLGDRIGERMRSRLAEMCVTVEMAGNDYRQGAKKANLR